MRSLVRFTATSAALGILVGIVFCLLSIPTGAFPHWLSNLQISFWPTSVVLMSTAGSGWLSMETLRVLVFALVTNALLYGFLGAGIWCGLNIRRWILCVVALIVAAVWYLMFGILPFDLY